LGCWLIFSANVLVAPLSDANDASLPKFTAAISRILTSFDTVNDWADVITFLQKLGKVRSQDLKTVGCVTVVLTNRVPSCGRPFKPFPNAAAFQKSSWWRSVWRNACTQLFPPASIWRLSRFTR
jgi:hypothetical protein